MKCHCGGELYQFQPGNNPIGGDVTGLPSVCRLCGEIRVDGKAVQLPASFQEKTAKLAEEAAQAGAEAAADLVKEPDPAERIPGYFATVYRRGYLAGFFRALAYFQHHAKEGRLARLRAIWEGWKQRMATYPVVDWLPADDREYAEFDKLIRMTPTGVAHGQGGQNVDPSRHAG